MPDKTKKIRTPLSFYFTCGTQKAVACTQVAALTGHTILFPLIGHNADIFVSLKTLGSDIDGIGLFSFTTNTTA